MKNNNSDYINAPEADYLFTAESLLPNAGTGLFTAIDIFKDEIIAVYGGEVLLPAEAQLRIDNGQDRYFIVQSNGTILDSQHSTCFARYANDVVGTEYGKIKNNAHIILSDKGEVCIAALRRIKANEEIYCDYGTKYWAKHK